MSLQIIRGRQQAPIRAIIYGTEGIGKTTLAAELPEPLILDTEDGTKQIDCARALCLDWRSIEHALKALIDDDQGFKTIVIDSADWLEKALIDHTLRLAGKDSIEDFGYGKGYTIIQEKVVKFLALVDKLIAKGLHVVFVAHAKVQRVSPPDTTDGYDRYELKLTKQVAPLLKEWADLILFCNYEVVLVEGSDKKIKAQGGRERCMYAERTAAWDAKNRFGLPEKLPMKAAEILHLFGSQAARPVAAPKAAPAPAAPAAPAEAPSEDSQTDAITPEQIQKLELYRQNSVGKPIIDQALEQVEGVDVGDLSGTHAAELIKQIQQRMNDSPTKKQLPADIQKKLTDNEAKANAYLVSINWINRGESWRDLSDEKVETITQKAERFLRAAGIGGTK